VAECDYGKSLDIPPGVFTFGDHVLPDLKIA
jgi:hypothetical protein